MASAYSTPKQFDNYVQPVNLELVNFVLGSKEQKFNYNIAKVEQTLQEFGQLGLVRDQDKEYLADRVNTMLTQMGDIENADWSDSNIERQITSGIRGSIDDRVIRDIQQSRNYTNYLKQVQEIKDKEPDKYSDINFAMGLKQAGADKWIKGETDEMGTLNYMPKVDYMGQMNKLITERIKTHGTKQVKRVNNGDGTFTNITQEVLAPETVRQIWQANMTPEMQKQMQMEAEYMYGSLDEKGQAEIINAYKENAIAEQNYTKQKLDLYESELRGTSDPTQKALIQEQIDYLKQSNIKLQEEIKEGVSFEEAYLNSYFKNTREKIVSANAFERTTDVELDYNHLKALKLKRDMLNDSNKTKEEEQANQYSKVADPTMTKDMAALTAFERTEEGMSSSIEGFTQAMTQNQDFLGSYGITLEEFNKKTPEQKIEFASAEIDKIVNEGIDLAAEKVYSEEEIKLAKRYSANKAVFDKVNTEIASTTDNIARTSYDAMKRGVENNSINVGNIRISAIKDAITSGKDFNQLEPDKQNAFRVAMIDEAIRRADINKGVTPYLLQQREELLKSIKSDAIRNQFSKEEYLTNTRGSFGANFRAGIEKTLGVLDYAAESLGGILNLDDIFGEQNRSEAKFERGNEFGKEASQRGSFYSILVNDEGVKEFQGDEFIVDGEPMAAMDFIRNKYNAVAETAEIAALESAPNLTSTSALIINPNIKSQQEIFNRASNYLAAHNGASVDDFRSSEMYMRVNPEDNTVTFSAKLSRTAAKDYSGGDLPDNRMISSDPIPISQIEDMGAIMNRIKTDQDEWALNSANKYAQNLKFSTSGFSSKEERRQAVEKMMTKLSPDVALALSQSPVSLGLTHSEMETYAEAVTRTTAQGEQRTLEQEFPNAYNIILSGTGKFEVNYKSRHNQGYFMDVSYKVGDKIIPIITNAPTGDTVLNPDEAYLEAYQAQTNIFFNILEGYQLGDVEYINILKEIDKING